MLADGTITLDQYSVATGIIEGSVKDAQAAYDAASGAVDAYSEKMTLAKIAAEGLDGGQAGVITNSKPAPADDPEFGAIAHGLQGVAGSVRPVDRSARRGDRR